MFLKSLPPQDHTIEIISLNAKVSAPVGTDVGKNITVHDRPRR